MGTSSPTGERLRAGRRQQEAAAGALEAEYCARVDRPPSGEGSRVTVTPPAAGEADG